MSFIQKTQEIRQRGKLHWFLVVRLRVLLTASIAMGVVFVYNLFESSLHPGWGSLSALLGFFISFLIFSRMDVIDWDEEKRKIAYRQMDIAAVVIFVLYVVFQIMVHTFINDTFPATALYMALALMFGSMCGRTAALARKINTVYENR